MNIGIFAFTGDKPTFETGVTTYNRVLLRALCGYDLSNQYIAYITKGNFKRYDDLNFDNLIKLDLGSNYFNSKIMDLRYIGPAGVAAFGFLMNKNKFFPKLINNLYNFTLPKEHRIDLLVYTAYDYLPFIPLFIKFDTNAPLISVIHDIRHIIFSEKNTYMNFHNLWKKYLIENSTLIIVPSIFIKRQIIKYYRTAESKIKVLCSIPETKFYILKETDDYLDSVVKKYRLPCKFLFFPSTIVETKNHLGLIKAIKILKEKGLVVNLILTGTISDQNLLFEEMKKLIAKFELSENIKHIGFIDEKEKRAMFKLATALIMPSIGESFSLPIWESFYQGCTVLSSNAFDMPEQTGDAAILFDPNNIEDMAEKIYMVWTNENLRQAFIKKGYQRVKDMTLENYAKQWEKIIGEAISHD